MLLEKPIATTIMRLAIPNGIVMTVQVLIGLLDVYFVSRLGVDALAGVAPVFPLVSLLVAVAQGAIGGGIVTTVARALGTGRVSAASDYAWYAVALAVPLGLATTIVMVALGPSLYSQMGISGNALTIAASYSSIIFAGAILIWSFNLLMAVVRGTGNLLVPVAVVCGGALVLVPLSLALILAPLAIKVSGPRAAPSRWSCTCLRNVGVRDQYLGSVRYPKAINLLAEANPRAGARYPSSRRNVGGRFGQHKPHARDCDGLCRNGGVEALAGYGAASRLDFLLVPLAYVIGGPVGIVVSANLGAGKTERAVKASWVGLLMVCTVTELIGLAAAAFPEAWIGMFSQDAQVLQVGANYLHRVGPFFGFFGLGYVLYCAGQATKRMGASVFAALLRAAIAVLGGFAVVWLKADITWNFVAVALGMVAFGLFALPPLICRLGYK